MCSVSILHQCWCPAACRSRSNTPPHIFVGCGHCTQYCVLSATQLRPSTQHTSSVICYVHTSVAGRDPFCCGTRHLAAESVAGPDTWLQNPLRPFCAKGFVCDVSSSCSFHTTVSKHGDARWKSLAQPTPPGQRSALFEETGRLAKQCLRKNVCCGQKNLDSQGVT